jgi:NAD(P)-dependent dehydrogenase (short-subunit alcohol dehydrogenase family)
MKKSTMPRVVNIASRLGTRPMEDSVAYCTCEAATIMLTKCCALELAKYNIKVNTVSPSLTITPLSKQSYSEEEIQATALKNPSKRLGKTEDTANLVSFLLSDKADYINGENVNVNGGILLK